MQKFLRPRDSASSIAHAQHPDKNWHTAGAHDITDEWVTASLNIQAAHSYTLAGLSPEALLPGPKLYFCISFLSTSLHQGPAMHTINLNND